jgi:predicted Co/Zn/Cd cation transporter (cation efflux family)
MSISANTPQSDEMVVERKAIGFSLAAGLVLAAAGLAIGIVTGSQVILFDGFYTFLGIGLSWMAMRVSHLVEHGPTTRYPFGREALTPLIIGVEGVALLATCAYASFNAVLTIIDGGSRLPSYWSISYACVALVLPSGLWWWLRRTASDSELASAEAVSWLQGAVLGLGMLVAFSFARIIIGTSWSPAARYVDPGLVIAACAGFITPPLRMIRTTLIELVEGSPTTDLQGPARAAVDEVGAQFGLGDRHLRMTKIGRKFYVEIDFVVDPSWSVGQSDQVRRALTERLDLLPHDLWLTVEFTADRTWGV